MNDSIFDYKDYKTYLNETLAKRPGRGRGMRSAMARAVRCQTAYISQVLNGPAHISLEQAESLNRFFGHHPEEAHFFLLLVQIARAGTRELQKYFSEQLRVVLERRLVLKNRLEVKKTLTIEDQAIYYSHWYYAAVHMILTLPEFQTKAAISRYLGLSVAKVGSVLEFLVSVGLARQEGERYEVGSRRMHLAHDSPMISKHHANWRMIAIRSLDNETSEDLHYSSVVTLSNEDVLKLKSILVKTIEQSKSLIRDSHEESIHCLSFDFFKL